jgi:hypothetical protein
VWLFRRDGEREGWFVFEITNTARHNDLQYFTVSIRRKMTADNASPTDSLSRRADPASSVFANDDDEYEDQTCEFLRCLCCLIGCLMLPFTGGRFGRLPPASVGRGNMSHGRRRNGRGDRECGTDQNAIIVVQTQEPGSLGSADEESYDSIETIDQNVSPNTYARLARPADGEAQNAG